MSDQPGLFAAGEPAPPPARPPRAVTYTRFKPAQRTSCDDCRRRLHTLGIARAPFPKPARWRRTAPDGTTDVLCQECTTARKAAES